ncbi:transaldolase family protein [Deinococcus sp. YIM 134068]|uniref:transaldolase family protein n=1 Tax=Deinococcus lichenicola TaxID=3118910 RepID=UPI002F922172
MYYNRRCFDEAGIQVPTGTQAPWTWATWHRNLETVTRGSDCRSGVSWDFQLHRWSPLLYQAGGSFMNRTQTGWAADTPAGERAMNFFRGLVEGGLLPRSQWLSGEDPAALFKNGLRRAEPGVRQRAVGGGVRGPADPGLPSDPRLTPGRRRAPAMTQFAAVPVPPHSARARRRPPRWPGRLRDLLLSLAALFFLLPVIWVVVSSFKSAGELFTFPPTLLPAAPTLDNYRRAWQGGDFARTGLNSLLVAGAGTLLTLPTSYPVEEDPGVASVRRIYTHFKEQGYSTVVMGASFRSAAQVEALAGCDRLTVSPALLGELDRDQGVLERALSPDVPPSALRQAILTESAFRWALVDNQMAGEKLTEGLRLFAPG